ncbi:hypothetical protein Pfo_020452 [Paulownia fortunei]|nr:hypothetical protein Pfo_020452 [Paulownia fortunei]
MEYLISSLLKCGSTTIAARSTVEFLSIVIREVPPRMTSIQFLRELEKRLWLLENVSNLLSTLLRLVR